MRAALVESEAGNLGSGKQVGKFAWYGVEFRFCRYR